MPPSCFVSDRNWLMLFVRKIFFDIPIPPVIHPLIINDNNKNIKTATVETNHFYQKDY